MRILLLHPEDSPRRGPWSRQRWDLIVDLGRSSNNAGEEWRQLAGCPILRVDVFREGIADAKRVREILSVGLGRLIDEEGIDWWDLLLLLFVYETETLLLLERLRPEIPQDSELWATRDHWPAKLLAGLVNRPLRTFGESPGERLLSRTMHYAGLARNLSGVQIKNIVLDKFDAEYRWRARFAAREATLSEPAVLVPSAYSNVSRMAAAYARILPDQKFLMVATRPSARQFEAPANVQVRDLASYVSSMARPGEEEALLECWSKMKAEIQSSKELSLLASVGIFDAVPGWIRAGLRARDAWHNVLDREPICGVLCGDDSNRYTRLPVLLASRKKIPTLDFHHGALDGSYVFKHVACDLLLAKTSMECDYLVRVCGVPADKVAMGAPASQSAGSVDRVGLERRSAILFSEPYEVGGLRAEEVYREILPPLVRVAREHGRSVIVKLHPFESRVQRGRLIEEILPPADRKLVTIVDGPLTADLMSKAWFGITIESTTAIDCWQRGIGCFLCRWMSVSWSEYGKQYMRFGIAEALESAKQIEDIPSRLPAFEARLMEQQSGSDSIDAVTLKKWLVAPSALSGVTSAS